MIGDDVGVGELERIERRKLLAEVPDARGQRLRGLGRARPLEHLPEERQRGSQVLAVARLIVEVPEEDAVVVLKGGDDVPDILAQLGVELSGVGAERDGGVLHPARVVHTGLGSGLLAVGRLGLPAVVEEDEQRADAVLRADAQEVVHALLEARGVVLVDHTAQEDAHGGEAELLCPSELLVDLGVVIGIAAPHLDLIDGSGGNIVAARHPGELRVPGVGLVGAPAVLSAHAAGRHHGDGGHHCHNNTFQVHLCYMFCW